MVICLEQGADLHIAQLMPLPLTVSCFSKIQIRFTFLILAHLSSPRQRAVKRVCVCCDERIYVFVCLFASISLALHVQSSPHLCVCREQHRLDCTAYTHTDPPGGSNGLGLESDIYDCLDDDV